MKKFIVMIKTGINAQNVETDSTFQVKNVMHVVINKMRKILTAITKEKFWEALIHWLPIYLVGGQKYEYAWWFIRWKLILRNEI